jgi:hypothetical protein
MIVLFLGFKTHHRDEVPEVVYLGNDASEGLKAVEAEGANYVRVGKLNIQTTIPIAIPENATIRAAREKQEAVNRQNAANAAASDLRKKAEEAKARAQKEAAEAQAALEAMEGTPENLALKERLAKEAEEAAQAAADAAEAERLAKEAEEAAQAKPVDLEVKRAELKKAYAEALAAAEAAEKPAAKKKAEAAKTQAAEALARFTEANPEK